MRSPSALDVRLHLVGFSNGGKGVWGAVKQLEHTDAVVSEVVFADANYGASWLDDTWAVLEPRGATMTILVGMDRGSGNRRRAASFVRARGESPRIRMVPVRAGHHAIGDAAVDFLGGAGTIDVLAGS